MSKRILLSFIFLFWLVGCGEEPAPTPTPVPTPTAVPTRTLPPQPTPTPTIPPTPTPLVPGLTAGGQTITDNGRLLIERVTVLEPAWVVIHAERDGQVGEVLGYTAVPAGESRAVEVTIDPLLATDQLAAIIHQDAGEPGEFEFPGVDAPLLHETAVVQQSFTIQRDMRLPALAVTDQAIAEDGLIRIANVTLTAPGWVVLYADSATPPGAILGHTFVAAGESADVVVHIPWRQGTPRLLAMLHQDDGRTQRFDFPDGDLPLLVAGEPVAATLNVTYPPDVLVLDQPVSDGRIVVERVISKGPGWLVVYQDDGNGSPGLIIGSAPLAAGLNEAVEVNLRESGVTPQLFIFLHEDTEPDDSFNFPAADPQITYQGRIPNPFSFRTDPGSYLITLDQMLAEDGDSLTAVVPLVVADTAVWVAIYSDDAGELGDLLGQTWLPPGLSRNISVPLDASPTTPLLYAVLHLDGGEAELFEPNGADVPLQRNRSIIRSPFSIDN